MARGSRDAPFAKNQSRFRRETNVLTHNHNALRPTIGEPKRLQSIVDHNDFCSASL